MKNIFRSIFLAVAAMAISIVVILIILIILIVLSIIYNLPEIAVPLALIWIGLFSWLVKGEKK